MEGTERHYTLEELADLVDLPIRTIRYYISQGLLPGPGARGKAALYGEEHLLRLRLIRLLSRQRVPLMEMREQLTHLSLNEIRALLAQEEEHAMQLKQADQKPSPQEYVEQLLRKAREARQAPLASSPPVYTPAPHGEARRVREAPLAPPAPASAPVGAPFTSPTTPAPEQWQRWELAPGVELHVRADSESQYHSLLERLFRAAGKVYLRSNK